MKRRPAEGSVNMTPMIDVVFQLIIFFVCTIELEKAAIDESIRLAMAPHGPAIEEKNPLEVVIDVDAEGKVSIAQKYFFTDEFLRNQLKVSVSRFGNEIPVVIRGDIDTRHQDIRKVMDACTAAGLWKVKFSAVKDAAKK